MGSGHVSAQDNLPSQVTVQRTSSAMGARSDFANLLRRYWTLVMSQHGLCTAGKLSRHPFLNFKPELT